MSEIKEMFEQLVKKRAFEYAVVQTAGINVTKLSRSGGVHYNNGENAVTYFSMILFNE